MWSSSPAPRSSSNAPTFGAPLSAARYGAHRPTNMYQDIKSPVPLAVVKNDGTDRLVRWNFARMNNPLAGITPQRSLKIKKPAPTLGHIPLALRAMTDRPDAASPAAAKIKKPEPKPKAYFMTLMIMPAPSSSAARPQTMSWWQLSAGKIARDLGYN